MQTLLYTAPRNQMITAIGGIVFFVAVVLATGLLAGPSLERVIILFLISLSAVAAMGIYCGNSGILSFGHVAFMGIGAYASALLTLPVELKIATLPALPDWLAGIQLSLFPALTIALAFTTFIGLLVGIVIGRLEGAAATISTLCLLIIVHGVLIGWRDVTRGAQTFFGVPRETDLWAATAGCLITLLLARWYRDSTSGLRLRAGRENAMAAQSVGIDVRGERLLAWCISVACMALAGGLLAHFLGAFSPQKFYFIETFFLLAMLIVGGMSTLTGAICGALAITVLAETLQRLEGGIDLLLWETPPLFGTTQIGVGLLILLAMFQRTEGLSGRKEWEERFFPPQRKNTSASLLCATSMQPLEAKNMKKHFQGLKAVNDVSLCIRPGEILGLIGPNGSGKTTLLNMLSGILPPSEGSMERNGVDLARIPVHDIVEHGIARTFQNIRLFESLSVYQNVLVAALSTRLGKDAEARAQTALEWMGIEALADMDAGTLSYGDQRRLEIARALACRPSLLFLDEPAAGMNRKETEELMEILSRMRTKLGIGILLVDHDLNLINRLSDRILVLSQGRSIADGTPAQIRSNPLVVAAYLGRRKEENNYV